MTHPGPSTFRHTAQCIAPLRVRFNATFIERSDALSNVFNEGLFGGHGEDIVLYEKYAYIAVRSTAMLNSFNGIVVYDVSDAHHPRFADSCRTPGNARGVFVDSALIYLADGDSGIAVLNNDLPHISTIRNGRPIVPVKSPDIQSSGKISRVELFSLNGRRIRSIHITGQAATHSIEASISPGIYHGVFEIDGYRHTRIVPVLSEKSGLR